MNETYPFFKCLSRTYETVVNTAELTLDHKPSFKQFYFYSMPFC